MNSRLLFCGLLVAALQTPSLSQGVLFGDGSTPTGTYTRAVSVDLDGDQYADLAGIEGDALDVRFSPAICDVLRTSVVTGAHDVAGIPGDAWDHDLAAVATDTGVKLVYWIDGAFVINTISTIASHQVVHEEREEVAKTLLILADDDRTVYRLTEDLNDPDGPWIATLLSVELADVFALASANLDAFRDPEICLVQTATQPDVTLVTVRNSNGSLKSSHVKPGVAHAVATVGDGSIREWLAVMITLYQVVPPGESTPVDLQFLCTLGNGSFTSVVALGGDPRVRAMTAANLNPGVGIGQDGVDDLVISYRGQGSIWGLHGQQTTSGAEPTFDPVSPGASSSYDYDALNTAEGNSAEPVSADIDGDGDVDTMMRIQALGKDFVYFNPAVDAGALKPDIPATLNPASQYVREAFLNPSNGNVELSFNLVQPVASIPGATHYEVTCYERSSPSGSTSPDPIGYGRVPIVLGDEVEVEVELAIPAVGGDTHFDEILFVAVRCVNVLDDRVNDRFPTRWLAMEAEAAEGDNYDYVTGIAVGGTNPVTLVHATAGQEDRLGSSGDDVPDLPLPVDGNAPPKGGN